MRTKKDNVMFSIINAIRLGGKLPKVSQSERTILRYVSILKKEGIIRKLGYGTWELTGKEFNSKLIKKNLPISSNPSQNPLYIDNLKKNPKNIRGHGFIVTFELPKIAGWYKREEFFKKKGIKFKLIGIKKTGQSIEFRDHKLHIYKKCIVIYSPKHKSYFSYKADKSFQYGLYDIIEVFKSFENLIGISLKINKSYKFRVSRQHYAKINDDLAKLFKSKGERLAVSDKNGGVWLITDNSLNLDELETVHKETAVTDMDSVVKPFFNDLRDYYTRTGETLILTDFLKGLHGVLRNQALFDANMQSHIKAVQDLSKGMEKFNQLMDKYNMENK